MLTSSASDPACIFLIAVATVGEGPQTTEVEELLRKMF
jgi:hypothetical protein